MGNSSVGQGSLVPVTPTSESGKSDKAGNIPLIENEMVSKHAEGAEASDPNLARNLEAAIDKKSSGEDKEQESNIERNDTSEWMQGNVKVSESDNAGTLGVKPVVKEEVADSPHEVTATSYLSKDVMGNKENILEGKFNEKADPHAVGEDAQAPTPGGSAQKTEDIASNMQVPQQMQQPSSDNIVLPQEVSYLQPGYHDGPPPQYARHGPGPDMARGMAPAAPIPSQERYPPPLQVPFGHPSNMPNPAQRPPGPPHPGPYHMQGPRPEMVPNQTRPPGSNFPETFPHQVQASQGQPPYGSFHSDGLVRAPGQVQGQGQILMPVPHGGGVRPYGEGMAHPPVGGPPPPPVMFDAPRGPPFRPEDQVGRLYPSNALEAEAYAARRPGFFDGTHPEPPFIQPGMNKVNGVPDKGPLAGGMHGSGFPDERFKGAADEHLRPFPVDPARRNVNRREFEEDLKQFPRPAHLDNESSPNFDSYISPRSLDRGHEQFGPMRPLHPKHSGTSFPAGVSGSEPHHMDFGERHRAVGFQEDFGRKPDPSEFNRNRMDGLPPLRSPGGEFGGLPPSRFGFGNQSRLNDFDVREPRGFGERSKAFNHPSDSASSMFHDGNRRNSLDGSDVLHPPFHPGDSFGSRNFPSTLRDGDRFHGSEPTGFGGYNNISGRMRAGDPGFVGNYSRHGFSNEAGPFNPDIYDHPRKRNPGSMGWCRICRIDCETVEGLDMHSQTREHQKMAMDMVLSIKQEVAKKQKLTSDDANKSRKGNFENHGNGP
ncbi:hypothetical protein ACMD2_06126 [Ananas comosus]|uniref:Uncharacterized protein n=1 Tax=Ananas comosus TaxID=4615 RepID=A0A199VJ73_ANACO|nr:hypothetical protein ACMD2_06126 [Ananas comosus]